MQVSENPKIQKATIADLLAIPDDERHHEIIDGVLYRKQRAIPQHGLANSRLTHLLHPYDRKPSARSPGGWWLIPETEVLIADDQIYKPDVSGWRRERLPELKKELLVRVVPDWVCEVLSTNRRYDLIEKKRGYHAARVPYYWIIDPEAETLSVHRWSEAGYVEVLNAARGETVRAEPFEAVEIRLGVLFGDDEDDEDDENDDE